MRNFIIRVLRGVLANLPVLNTGELYFCTDTNELYVGGSSANQRVAGSSATLSVGGSGSATVKGPNAWTTGPANPSTIVKFEKVNIAGVVYWMSLFQ